MAVDSLTSEDGKACQIAEDILDECRVRLMMQFRFMDVALWKMPFVPGMGLRPLSTDGMTIEYNPWLVVDRFEEDPDELTRDLLHCILHCVFRQPFDASHAIHDAWWMACDVSIEVICGQMCEKHLTSDLDQARQNYAAHLEKQIGALTAPNLYRLFCAELQQQSLDDEAPGFSYLDDIKELYSRDDHGKWPKGDDDPNRKAQRGEDSDPSPENGDPQDSDEQGESNDDSSQTNQEQSGQTTGGGSQEPSEEGSGMDAAEDQPQSQEPSKEEEEDLDSSEQDTAPFDDGVVAEQSANPQEREDDPTQDEQDPDRTAEEWEVVGKQIEVSLDTFLSGKAGGAAGLAAYLSLANRKRLDYRAFLRKFAHNQEDLHVSDDEFDYIFYTYGLSRYGNMPIIEPLEYCDQEKITSLVLAIDTSGSCAGEAVKAFLEATFEILEGSGLFSRGCAVHVVQCDDQVQQDTVITEPSQVAEVVCNYEVRGFGGTDFRPVFTYVDELVAQGKIENLQGLLYFTDGQGTFPKKPPAYKAAFLFLEDKGEPIKAPAWAIKAVMTSDQIIEMKHFDEKGGSR